MMMIEERVYICMWIQGLTKKNDEKKKKENPRLKILAY